MTFYLHKSDKPTKKYYVDFENPATSRIKRIYFGAIKPDGTPYSDFLDHKDITRRTRYRQRHQAREDWSSPYAGAGVWSRYLLWGEDTLPKSIKAMEKHFNIKIVNKTRGKSGGEKHSAYRSMKLAQRGLTKPTTKANRGRLLDWSREKWVNLTALLTDKKELACGTKGKKQKEKGLPSVCRPSVKVNKKTPMLAKEFSEKQIRKAIKQKQQGKTIKWRDL